MLNPLSLSKVDLHLLADGLLLEDHSAIDDCVAFVLADTEGYWHGRARAMMCRRLKHCELSAEQRAQLLACILDRLNSGHFSEQFLDQVRFAIHLDRDAMVEAAANNLRGNVKPHVSRYSAWILQHHSTLVR